MKNLLDLQAKNLLELLVGLKGPMARSIRITPKELGVGPAGAAKVIAAIAADSPSAQGDQADVVYPCKVEADSENEDRFIVCIDPRLVGASASAA